MAQDTSSLRVSLNAEGPQSKMVLAGSEQVLGWWDPSKSAELTWTGKVWETVKPIELTSSRSRLDFKFVQLEPSCSGCPVPRWEAGPFRALEVPAESAVELLLEGTFDGAVNTQLLSPHSKAYFHGKQQPASCGTGQSKLDWTLRHDDLSKELSSLQAKAAEADKQWQESERQAIAAEKALCTELAETKRLLELRRGELARVQRGSTGELFAESEWQAAYAELPNVSLPPAAGPDDPQASVGSAGSSCAEGVGKLPSRRWQVQRPPTSTSFVSACSNMSVDMASMTPSKKELEFHRSPRLQPRSIALDSRKLSRSSFDKPSDASLKLGVLNSGARLCSPIQSASHLPESLSEVSETRSVTASSCPSEGPAAVVSQEFAARLRGYESPALSVGSTTASTHRRYAGLGLAEKVSSREMTNVGIFQAHSFRPLGIAAFNLERFR